LHAPTDGLINLTRSSGDDFSPELLRLDYELNRDLSRQEALANMAQISPPVALDIPAIACYPYRTNSTEGKIMRAIRLIYIILAAVVIQGCHVESNRSSEDLSYRLKINNTCMGSSCDVESNQKCETVQSFNSKDSYCLGLRDAELNKDCARSQRKSLYIQSCGSTFEDINISAGYSWSSACTTDRRLHDGKFTRSQLCSGMKSDRLTNPCVDQRGWHGAELKRYECDAI
jgi:hypothetical protein